MAARAAFSTRLRTAAAAAPKQALTSFMNLIKKRKGKPPLSISPDSLPGGSVGVAYRQAFTASGGPPPYTYSYDGALPPGLSLSTDGVISGTPAVAGSSSFTVTVTDKKSNAGSQPY